MLQPSPSFDKAEFTTKRFLIVDDFDGMRNLLRDLLRRCGARQIDVAATGNEALAALNRSKYDIVLCDYIWVPARTASRFWKRRATRT